MKFKGIKIEEDYANRNKGKFRGRIHFETENGSDIYLNLDDAYSHKLVEVCLPLFIEATSEKIEIIRKELGFSDEEISA